ncbi:hypothetical protein [Apilactobacillus timberlakei]|uniref:Uncharacterized protein n=1 Tax=Apilactobacillus timberlakei TaxID=2008380 RepID=A0ABY2YZ39_9LACO|nr:hypothetical protein [Apilactobacillus timberlakei]TPR14835.1 hypothetical protein DYZ97_01490 [Apilactobacillus timberlakei]TPR15805.1 hypothetical protein DY052_04290 [Apilactobacillus timberlakei]TPR16166.1 hypothetical protein DY048_01505 [Apilactobacillus timberlakei]
MSKQILKKSLISLSLAASFTGLSYLTTSNVHAMNIGVPRGDFDTMQAIRVALDNKADTITLTNHQIIYRNANGEKVVNLGDNSNYYYNLYATQINQILNKMKSLGINSVTATPTRTYVTNSGENINVYPYSESIAPVTPNNNKPNENNGHNNSEHNPANENNEHKASRRPAKKHQVTVKSIKKQTNIIDRKLHNKKLSKNVRQNLLMQRKDLKAQSQSVTTINRVNYRLAHKHLSKRVRHNLTNYKHNLIQQVNNFTLINQIDGRLGHRKLSFTLRNNLRGARNDLIKQNTIISRIDKINTRLEYKNINHKTRKQLNLEKNKLNKIFRIYKKLDSLNNKLINKHLSKYEHNKLNQQVKKLHHQIIKLNK